ncbi:MAG TPA: cbb3-type cytochrome c oxidase subunit I, partial [Daejeonella sp.]|nr:cbb3-type cytochrome c oxidase subunit I [Daejeonella sp.]
ALMEYGSMFGDGANRGPDYTAEALHRMSEYMNDYYKSGLNSDENSELAIRGAQEQVKYEIKANQYDKNTNSVKLADSQVAALSNLEDYYKNIFTNPKFAGAFKPMGYIKDEEDIKSLSKFFFWGAWVCGVERPGETYSYTHNWPFDPSAGNTPTSATIIWSIIGSLGLLLGLGIVLYYYGRMDKLDDDAYTNKAQAFMTKAEVAKFAPDEIQHATFKYFYVAILLFGTQVLAGILTVHDFVGFVNFFGFDISKALPVTITRSWHVQLSLLWISACWIGASFFMMSLISPAQAKSQVKLINTIFWLTVLLVAGSMVGMFLGPHGLLAKSWYWLGHQGWEYVELGKIWQIILGIVFIIWAITIYRGIKPVMKVKQPWALPNWLVYTTFSIIL